MTSSLTIASFTNPATKTAVYLKNDGLPLIIGRNDPLLFVASALSRKQVEITYKDGMIWVKRTGINRSLLNNVGLEKDVPKTLSDGDKLTLVEADYLVLVKIHDNSNVANKCGDQKANPRQENTSKETSRVKEPERDLRSPGSTKTGRISPAVISPNIPKRISSPLSPSASTSKAHHLLQEASTRPAILDDHDDGEDIVMREDRESELGDSDFGDGNDSERSQEVEEEGYISSESSKLGGSDFSDFEDVVLPDRNDILMPKDSVKIKQEEIIRSAIKRKSRFST